YHPTEITTETMKYKLIAADMDGTLLNDELTVSQANLDAIERFRQAGGIFTITTGRAPCGVENYVKLVGLDEHPAKIVCNIGGTIVDSATFKAEKIFAMPPERTAELIKFLSDNTELVMVYAEDGLKISELSKIAQKYCEYVKIDSEVKDDLAGFVKDPEVQIAKVMAILDERKIDEVMKAMRDEFTEYYVLQSTAPFLKRLSDGDDFKPAMIECVLNGVNKGTGLKYVADYYGVPMSQVIALGDSYNDADMIEAAGLGIAMGNAKEPIKKIADYVTDTNNADGVAKAINKFCFNEDEEN
ncbi:MAG: Cof-type HAD-IIB family hydrolase, partial [Clostridiales bacterium]|nr:Cof-type HAD-IIB family hydrolase [Clostridiales bacterium]